MADTRLGDGLWNALQGLPRGSGVLLLRELKPRQRRRLHRIAKLRALQVVVEEPRTAARVHDQRELRQALLRRAPFILISPVHRTRSHPDWAPMPRMRAATLAQLSGRKAIALGGMNAKRYAKIAQLGFSAWAGIDAFRT
jgi:thiamine-phosphate pyrophosphorylase